MDLEKLAAAAAAGAVGAFAKGATEAAIAEGRKVWDWARSKLAGTPGAAVVLAAEAAPEKASSRKALEAQLLLLLEDNPAFAGELAALLREAGVTQNASVTGNQNVVTQIAGSGNSVTLPRR
jgi:hypothetical protein